MMNNPRLFLSYRREDSPYAAGRLYDHLVDAFGEEAIYFDVAGSCAGIDFRRQIADEIAKCDAVIVVIGEKWLVLEDAEGNRRIDQPNDMVHIEIRSALDRGVPVTPIFVDNAKVPNPMALPEVLRDLCYRNGYEAGYENFREQIKVIIKGIHSGINYYRKMSAAGPPLVQTAVIEEVPPEIFEPIVPAEQTEVVSIAGKAVDVFISYAHADNMPFIKGEKGWVSNLSEYLQKILSFRLGRQANIWMDDGASFEKSLCDEKVDRLENAAVVVAVITPRYLKSEWCLRELEMFRLKISNDRVNVFPVYPFPISSRDQLPENIQGILGYSLYSNKGGALEWDLKDHREELLRNVIILASQIAFLIQGKELADTTR
jgi:hypothetical protein